jgi:hypothetical protein
VLLRCSRRRGRRVAAGRRSLAQAQQQLAVTASEVEGTTTRRHAQRRSRSSARLSDSGALNVNRSWVSRAPRRLRGAFGQPTVRANPRAAGHGAARRRQCGTRPPMRRAAPCGLTRRPSQSPLRRDQASRRGCRARSWLVALRR